MSRTREDGCLSSLTTGTPLRTQAAELLVLTSVAVAQPLFDLLGRYATFFVAHRASAGEIAAFALFWLLAPALLMFAAIRLVQAVSSRAGAALHLATLGLLAGLAIGPPVARSLALGTAGWAAAVGACAAAATWLLARWTDRRQAVAWVSVTPSVFAVVFLVGTPVRTLVFPTVSESARAHAGLDTPVVLLVLDELPLAALQRPDGSLDGVRFPNFARLAAMSTWYQQATTNADDTVHAVPALLTGRWIREDRLPSVADYPDNLLTHWGRSYPLQASEYVTGLCAVDACGRPKGSLEWRAMVIDATVVYLHAILPRRLAAQRLPPLAGRWANFVVAPSDPTGDASEDPDADGDQAGRFARLLAQLEPSRDSRMWYLHLGLPHLPWEYLPTGQQYDGTVIGGLDSGHHWAADERSIDHALQRFLLQLKFVDGLIGRLLDRLTETGLDRNALVIVVADHGATFRTGSSRRDFDLTHPSDVLPIPLFIRYPGQPEAVIDARPAQLIDVVPTLADVLDMPLPWTVDGRSLRSPAVALQERHVFAKLTGPAVYEGQLGQRFDLSRRIEALFGPSGAEDDLYAMGPFRALLGSPAPLSVPGAPVANMEIEPAEALAHVEPTSRALPAMVTAAMRTGPPPGTPVAVAVNEIVAGVGWVQGATDGEGQLTVMLAPRLFRAGANALTVYRIDPAGRLHAVGRLADRRYRLESDGDGAPVSRIIGPDGRQYTVRTEGIRAHIERFARSGDTLQVSGWAIDTAAGRAPRLFLVAEGQRVVATGTPWPRPDVAARFQLPMVTDTGIRIRGPGLSGDGDAAVYAIFENGAYRLPLPE